MEFLLSFPATALFGTFAFLLFFFNLLLWKPTKRHIGKKRTAPEAAGAWPVIGHLHLLGGSDQLPHIKLGAMADKFGPIFTIKLGVHRALVVSNWELAQECLTTNDRVFANRPKFIAAELLGYNYGMFVLSPYDQYWRQVRKIVTLELLSNRRVEMFGHIRESEVKISIKKMYQQWVEKNRGKSDADKVVVEMSQWFSDLIQNVVCRMLVGKRYWGDEEERVRFQKVIRELFGFLGMFLVADAFPLLRCLDLGGGEKAMKRTAKETDSMLEKWLEEHKQKRDSGMTKGEQDFMDVMMANFTDNIHGYDADTIIKATSMVVLLGGLTPQ